MEQKITCEFDQAAIQYLGKKGYDPLYGARPLKRVLQSEVLNPLSKKLLAGELAAGNHVKVTGANQRLEFQVR